MIIGSTALWLGTGSVDKGDGVDFRRLSARLIISGVMVGGLTVTSFGVAYADGGGWAPVPPNPPTIVLPQPDFGCQKQQGHDATLKWFWDGHKWVERRSDVAYC